MRILLKDRRDWSAYIPMYPTPIEVVNMNGSIGAAGHKIPSIWRERYGSVTDGVSVIPTSGESVVQEVNNEDEVT